MKLNATVKLFSQTVSKLVFKMYSECNVNLFNVLLACVSMRQLTPLRKNLFNVISSRPRRPQGRYGRATCGDVSCRNFFRAANAKGNS